MNRAEVEAILESIRINLEDVRDLIRQLHDGEAWLAVDCVSWKAFAAEHLAPLMPNLDIAERREMVAELSERGMSTREIAATIGVSDMTVRRDIEDAQKSATPVADSCEPAVNADAIARLNETRRMLQAVETLESALTKLAALGVQIDEPKIMKPINAAIDEWRRNTGRL